MIQPNKLLLFAAKIMLLVIPVLLVLGGLFLELPRNPESYFCGFNLKDNLLKSAKSPKILLVGGSNLAFGTDSQKLSSEFGINVVNTGLHVSLGSNFMLNWAEENIRGPGDIVIVSFEYWNFLPGTGYRGDITLCEVLFEVPGIVRYFGLEHIVTIWEGTGRTCWLRLLRCLKGIPFKPDAIYNVQAFNKYGDVVSHLDVQEDERSIPQVLDPALQDHRRIEINSPAMKRFQQFINCVEAKGTRVYILPPCLRDNEYLANSETINFNYNTLKKVFPRQVLSKPSDFVFGANYFFDTEYHLNRKGREIRTAKMIQYIRAAEAQERAHYQ